MPFVVEHAVRGGDDVASFGDRGAGADRPAANADDHVPDRVGQEMRSGQLGSVTAGSDVRDGNAPGADGDGDEKSGETGGDAPPADKWDRISCCGHGSVVPTRGHSGVVQR